MGFFKSNTIKIEPQGNLLQEMEEGDSNVYVALDPIYEKYKTEIDELLLNAEGLESVHPLIIDYLCVTNKRLIFVDNDTLTDALEIISLPYKNICDVSIKKGSSFKMTNELKIRTKGKNYKLKFIKGREILEIYNKIIEKIID